VDGSHEVRPQGPHHSQRLDNENGNEDDVKVSAGKLTATRLLVGILQLLNSCNSCNSCL
jgi:hypothetical protein